MSGAPQCPRCGNSEEHHSSPCTELGSSAGYTNPKWALLCARISRLRFDAVKAEEETEAFAVSNQALTKENDELKDRIRALEREHEEERRELEEYREAARALLRKHGHRLEET